MTRQTTALSPNTDGSVRATPRVRSPRYLALPGEPLSLDHGRLTMFMANNVTCPACRVVQRLAGKSLTRRLHVVFSAEELVVTEADDLHNPGRSICGRRILDGKETRVFRLMPEPLDGMKPERHTVAHGIAVLSWRNGRRHLKAIGRADGLPSFHDCLIDAVELPAGRD